VRAVLQKLGVRSQLAAVAMVNRAGWKPDDGERVDLVNSDDERRHR
jgi:hypothetical protein